MAWRRRRRWRRCLPLWAADEVSCVVTVALKFLSVVSASVLGRAVRGAGDVRLGSGEVAGGTGTVVPRVEVLRLRVVALGDNPAAVVAGGFGARVATVTGVLMLRVLALVVVVPSSGRAVGALVGLLGEVGAVLGGSARGESTREPP